MIDVVHQINAVQRRVGPRVVEGGEARVVTISQVYDTGIDDMWDACTNPERIRRWFLPVSGDLRPGGRYQLEGNAGGTIEECDPPRRFAATWEYGDTVSRIEVCLSVGAEHRTRLELEHSVPIDEQWSVFGPGAVGVGWEMGLVGLAVHLASGKAVETADFTAWSTSADGRRFVRLSCERWCEADVAGGADEGDARARAARTADAYGGGQDDAG